MGWRTEMRGGLVKGDSVSHVNNIHLEYSNVTYNTQYRHIFSPRYICGHREEGRKIPWQCHHLWCMLYFYTI